MDLTGRTALITGGASGLGNATARELHAAGANVVLFDLPRSEGKERAADLGERAAYVPGDVTDSGTVEEAVGTAVEQFGRLDVAVNCAGIDLPQRTAGRKPADLDGFKAVIDINLVGTFNVTRLAAQQMIDQEPLRTASGDGGEDHGVIVNTASIAAFEGQIGQAAYAASKGGIVSLTLAVARDLARHAVRCVTVAPGTFDTPLLAGVGEELLEALRSNVPNPPRLGDPREFAALVRHVVENPYLNGETIRLDGALRMPPK